MICYKPCCFVSEYVINYGAGMGRISLELGQRWVKLLYFTAASSEEILIVKGGWVD